MHPNVRAEMKRPRGTAESEPWQKAGELTTEMSAEETGKHNFIRGKRVTNFAELWTSLWILGCTGNSLIEIIKDVCACGHVVRMVPSLIILCLGCSPILPIIIFCCHRSNVHWILKVPDMAYCLCCIYFIIFVFFALHQSQDTVLPLGCFFFKDPPPRKNSRWRLWRPALSTNQNPSFWRQNSIPPIRTLDFKPPKVSWLKRHRYYWSRIQLTMLFFLLYLVTQEEEIFGRVNEGVRVSLAFFCLICVLLPIPNKCWMCNVIFLQMYFQDEVVQELKQIYAQLEEGDVWDLSLESLQQVTQLCWFI